MTRFRWRTTLLVVAVALAMSVSAAHAATRIYLYDPAVVDDIDLNAYLLDGTVKKAGGGSFAPYVQKGPAPSSYPTIDVSANSFEHLGTSNVQIDGVVFLNHGNYYVPNKEAIVLWTVRIPNASQRAASEFQKDLTLSLWIDWNADSNWKPSERMITRSFNLANQFPNANDEIVIEFVTSFIVPNIMSEEFLSAQAKYGNSDKDLRYLWVRALVAYDDPDVSPDGDQLFGEYEDYRVVYFVQQPYTAKN
ncbi:MAG TPA: GEVED domain-containing protein [Candidatus Krumholzibacteria bacterium]